MDYKTHLSLKKILDEILFRNINNNHLTFKLFMPFCLKRKEFHHENEIRMFYFHKLPTVPILNLIRSDEHSADDLNFIIKGIKTCFDKRGSFITSNYKKLLSVYLSPFKDKENSVVPIELKKYNIAPKDIIDDVMVHPLASNYYVKIVEKYCNRFDLKFLGKSKLYEFK